MVISPTFPASPSDMVIGEAPAQAGAYIYLCTYHAIVYDPGKGRVLGSLRLGSALQPGSLSI